MSGNGSLAADGFLILCALALICGLVLWMMPAESEARLAATVEAVMQSMRGQEIDWASAQVVEQQHAITRHGPEAEAVRQCLKQNGPYQVWQKPDGRFVRVCLMPDGKFGTQICMDGDCGLHEITAYIKNKFAKLEQLIRYLENMGATRVWP